MFHPCADILLCNYNVIYAVCVRIGGYWVSGDKSQRQNVRDRGDFSPVRSTKSTPPAESILYPGRSVRPTFSYTRNNKHSTAVFVSFCYQIWHLLSWMHLPGFSALPINVVKDKILISMTKCYSSTFDDYDPNKLAYMLEFFLFKYFLIIYLLHWVGCYRSQPSWGPTLASHAAHRTDSGNIGRTD